MQEPVMAILSAKSGASDWLMAILIVPKTELLIGHLGPMLLLCLLVQPNTAQESTEKYIMLC